MSRYVDAIVWIVRNQAKIFHFSTTDEVKLVILHTSAQRQHHRADHEDGTKHAVDTAFLQSITESLDQSAGGILLTGRGNSKFELQRHIDQHHPEMAARISGVEALDDPADAEILDLARRFFRTRGHRHPIELGYDARKNDATTH